MTHTETATTARATVGSGRTVHHATVHPHEFQGRSWTTLTVSCGANRRAGSSQVRRVRDDAPVTCRKC